MTEIKGGAGSLGAPDLGVATLMAGIFLTSFVQILRQAWTEYRDDRNKHPVAAE